MNNDLPSSYHRIPDAHTLFEGGPAAAQAAPGANNDGEEQHKRHLQQDRKAACLDHLIRNIDIMIYCQLSVLYYMDISFLKFLLRALPQWFYFTPKPALFPMPPPAARPYIGAIFSTNLLCLLLHIISSPPAASEATRGYLHGGILIDFVGQESPVSRIRLVSLDMLTCALQLVILAIVLERRKIVASSNSESTADESLPFPSISRHQDHDSEERGILRPPASPTEDIELPPLSSGRTGADEDRERNELLRHGTSPRSSIDDDDDDDDDDHGVTAMDEHPLDRFHSGQHVLADMYLMDVVRTQWLQRRGAVPEGGVGASIRRRRVLMFSGGRLTAGTQQDENNSSEWGVGAGT